MLFGPKPLDAILDDDILKKDKKECRKFGPCGVGKEALYLNSFYIDRRYYVPIRSVTRIYKRIAMSRGGFTGRGIFASIPYLVVEYGDGKSRQCNFKFEERVDDLLHYFHARHPEIPVHSQAGERLLEEKARRLAEKQKRMAESPAKKEIRQLADAAAYLERKPELYRQLAKAARQKRVSDQTNPAYRWVALAIVILGAFSLIFGIRALLRREGFAMYFLLFGLSALFMFSGARVLPTRRTNRRYILAELTQAEQEMEAYISRYPGFPVPARYAHPYVLKWMQEILADQEAADAPQALEKLKLKLKGLNSQATVEQEEYEEIMAMKPMFLVNEYR